MDRQPDSFEEVRRLVALKRHESPPPGYFQGFSIQVIRRIKAGELGDAPSFFQRLLAEPAWFQRLLAAFDAKPAAAGALGLAVCGVLVAGVFYSERSDSPTVAVLPPVEPMSGALQVANWMPGATEQRDHPGAVQFLQTSPTVLQNSLFNDLQRYRPAQQPMLIDYRPQGQ